VVSGRVAKKATTRNRLKRQIRAAAAQWIAKTIDGGGYDTVIHAIPRRTAPTFTQIFKDFEQCLNQKTNARTAQWRATR
jgi:ribonuclease P protein component